MQRHSVSCVDALLFRSLSTAAPLYADCPCKLAFCASPPEEMPAIRECPPDNRDVGFHAEAVAARKRIGFDTVLADAVLKIDDRFSAIFPERLHDGLQRQQLAVGVECV